GEITGILGALWAETLRSARYRGEAIAALRATLQSLGHGADARRIATSLGAAVRARMSAEEIRMVRRTLAHELGRPSARGDLSRQLVSALLTALAPRAATPLPKETTA